MRTFVVMAVLLVGCGDDGAMAVELPMCGTCASDAQCVLAGSDASCVCNPGFEGDGTTCTDVDECAAANGGCDANATCTNGAGYRVCECKAEYEGDGKTCAPLLDVTKAGCAVMEAEHPGYTNIARDVVLCGSQYVPATMATACSADWHVCKKTEWLGRYPTDRPYGAVPDETYATIGKYTSWGYPQALRCPGYAWMSTAPAETITYDSSVCYYPTDTGDNADGADYLPSNDGKFLYDDDGTTILQGRNAMDQPDCCSWDVTFGPTTVVTDFAVYCCRN